MASDHVLAVHGTVLVHEQTTLPPGSVVTVKLVDAVDGPTPFELHADPADVTNPRLGAPPASSASGELRLWARLRSEAGTWGTVDLVSLADWGRLPLAGENEIVVTKVD